jgi:hypothetical protein
MSTQPTPAAREIELPKISPAEVARVIRRAERLRAEYIAGLLRAVGRRLARSARALAAPRAPRPRERAA